MQNIQYKSIEDMNYELTWPREENKRLLCVNIGMLLLRGVCNSQVEQEYDKDIIKIIPIFVAIYF